MRRLCAAGLGVAAACAAAPFTFAEIYLTEDEAGALLLPGETLSNAAVTLTEAQQKQIAKESGVRVRSAQVRALRASGGGWLLFDQVVGKHEFIDFALALTRDGSVKGVEILTYSERYGGQVRDPKWRAQFAGKTSASPLKLDEDIVNISGATLSCNNVTRGVRRLLCTWRVALKTP